jgi:hypothetical protein
MTDLVEQADREAAAKVLGYKDWGDATDYRLTGAQDRQVEAMCKAFAAHRHAAIKQSTLENKELREALSKCVSEIEASPIGDFDPTLKGIALRQRAEALGKARETLNRSQNT